MKRALVLGLAVLKVTVIDPTEVKATVGLEQQPQQTPIEQIKQERNNTLTPQTPNQAVQNPQPKHQLTDEATRLQNTQFSERDRLIQERFLIKLIPAQNQ